jgi:penicillin-binding protein 2
MKTPFLAAEAIPYTAYMPFRGFFRRRRRVSTEIQPDEIFIDASNLPSFDTDQFEGRLERPIDQRSYLLLSLVFLLIFLSYAGRAGLLTILRGTAYAELSEKNRLEQSYVFADRGIIEDRNGIKLAYDSHESGDPFARRIYAPYRGLGTVLGYTRAPAKDSTGFYYQDRYIGAEGVEKSFDARLTGVNGEKLSETDALGHIVSESTIAQPKPGETITLSIDAELTQELYNAIAQRAEESGFSSGAGAFMNVETGELIALTSYPTYDPQTMTDKKDQAAIRGYLKDTRMPFLNRATTGLFTPGSIVKPFFAIGALEENIISPTKQIYSSGALIVPNPYDPAHPSVFKDWKAHGWVDMRKAIEESSDEYFYAVGGGTPGQEGLGITRLEKYARLFGFGSPTGIEGFSEKVGTVPNPAWKAQNFPDDPDWRLGNTYHTAIGQYGFQVTPLQALRAVSAIANGGYLVQPTVEAGKKGARQKIDVDPSHVQIVKEGMRLSAQNGTAKALNVNYIEIAAKTGTAEQGVAKDKVNSWVMGFFPYEHPKYAFVILLERGPRANLFGSPGVARLVLDWMWQHDSLYLK